MKIGVVLVTYNRLEKIKVALQKYEEQEYKPEYILVVDNCSTDGTNEFLNIWEKNTSSYRKEVITLPSNSGGAGGFYSGMERALNLEADWIWLSDDDAYPRKDALKNINDYYENLTSQEKKTIVAMCSTVYNNGEIHKEHRNHIILTKLKCIIQSSSLKEYEKKAFSIDMFSYVGAIIKKDTIKKVGLDIKDFFIYCDDQEHSIRIGREGKIMCITNSIIDHDTLPYDKNVINWGRYYKKRNDLLMIKKNYPYRYFFFRFIRRYISDVSLFSKNPPELKIMLKDAYRDAWNNKTGLHDIYRPGWNIAKK